MGNRWWLWLVLATPLLAQRLALSLDDAPFLRESPRMSASAQHRAMLGALKSHQVQAILFANGVNGGDTPEGLAILKAWGEAGHLVANHSYTHWDLNRPEVTLKAYQDDLLKEDAILAPLPGFTRLFRYPFLRGGSTEAKREGMYAFLTEHRYGIGHVSIDTADWLIDERLRKRLAKDPLADLTPYRNLYLAHLWACARFYSAWSRHVFGREIPHVLLLHCRLLNGLFLGEVLASFEAKGWTWMHPLDAFADPVYRLRPKNLPGGEALADAVAAEKGEHGFVAAWRSENKDPDGLLFSEGRLVERLDAMGL